ncbi:RHS repeat-associated core domain-containing protein [Dysgonomonas sp. ZJ279]|uniref:RHS repeat-associated core domain-containing protein n=1 Tax=Dysgonomonas sp. ZJ279 TaxID=2709796 RepID=UPI00210842F2|nr:RHS repeat-associated core domain-containing protein [Dysgonomonas sp. ZJ279]
MPVVQKSHYYPFGMAFAESTDLERQPYKYNGKELDRMHQLNMYDYHARQMEPGTGRFMSVDPLAEKYYNISPYAYVKNNPLKYIDPTGMWSITSTGWTTSNPDDIEEAMNNLKSKNDGVPSQKQQAISNLSSLSDMASFGGFMDKVGEYVMDLFAIKTETTYPNGEVQTNYTARDYKPQYVGLNISFSWYLGGGSGFDHNLGYIRDDGFFHSVAVNNGLGVDFSGTASLQFGYYSGAGKATIESLEGHSINQSYGLGTISIGTSHDITHGYVGKKWNMGSIGYSYGSKTFTGFHYNHGYTFSPTYINKFNK